MVQIWNGSDHSSHKCKYYKSVIKNCNSCYVFRDFEDDKLFPEKKFGGKYRFDSKGEKHQTGCLLLPAGGT